MESLKWQSMACFVASFATDYGDLQNRDPLDRASKHVIGIGRASMANRLSYSWNIKGPSVIIDTACSGSMVALHLAHTQEVGSLGLAHSSTGLCHTFDASADGYIKSEAVSAIIIKRLSDAIRDRDSIRAVPSSEAQAATNRQVYASAGITDFNDTAYLEAHGNDFL
ncbi:beta-ketoacyl [acyl carrier protein] synthase domain-containing protein [Aspergillus homomorphus CBS 101889]|uniref:Thiolase-like protein n=1 Tax=Aspergillus homomorphus (strain CBS 101889) TaxID=1450537 RepID=A0A395HYN4_ASPHC|nr:thiolase-like protein [Aspergillus homomorphus CBS 101889]RAL13041.1 thiolase-like protein [Aspergillus homomorphus CBS 101889]